MSDLANSNPDQPLPARTTKSGRIVSVNGRNKTAIDAMVWEGLKRSEAAAKAGLTDHSLYVALTRPHVKAYYLQQCEVLRLSGRARRIHRLEAMVEQDDNKAAVVNAALALERLGPVEESGAIGAVHQPGVTIKIVQQIVQQPSSPQPIVIENDDASRR